MGAQENIKVVQELQQAVRDRDDKRYSELLAEDAVILFPVSNFRNLSKQFLMDN